MIGNNWMRAFQESRNKAREILNDSQKMQDLAERSMKLLQAQQDRLAEAGMEFKTLNRMLLAYVRGEYKAYSLKTILSVLGALLYFVNPLDLIPDFIVGLGFVDDLSVLAFVVKQIGTDLERFREWEEAQTQDDIEIAGI
ncbi:MAG: DUF1232 domain-containing protein [Flavobacteriales bacterium]|nr:DUF1232 domain-containing protein [Flavobacteriales bacterium]